MISIVIVHYRVEKELVACISSIIRSESKVSYEIIVVDNDIGNSLKITLKEKFPKVRYVKAPSNIGYGAGNNLGAKQAHGNYLFFLNPDTSVVGNAIEELYKFIKSNKSIGIASPLLVDNKLIPSKTQSRKELTPLNAIYSFSFLRKFFPKKSIYNDDFFKYWDKKLPIEVDTVPGAALIISKKLFDKINGFDEHFFLYFEENDLSKRIKKIGYKQFIYPKSKIIHAIGQSTKQIKSKEDIFVKSRFYYLKKHYGLIPGIFTELFIRINKISAFLLLVIIIGTFLRVYKIGELMPFIGDQGWFYLSARDMIVDGQIPLVGIPSSHPWLHQGPLWTYILAVIFGIFGFNPVNGAYFSVILGIFTVLIVYIAGSEMFPKRVGLIATFLYATSPLAVIYSRTPYHTSPIPLFTLLYFFSLYKFIKGNNNFFPLSILFLSILYNLELATAILWFVLLIILFYGIWKKAKWVKKIFNRKILLYSFLAFLIPMTPIIIYDFNNNYPQTLKFVIWIGYRILKFFGFPSIHGEADIISLSSMFTFSFQSYRSLIFAASSIVSLVILVVSFSMLFINAYGLVRRKIKDIGFILLFLWISISSVGYFINKTPSEAYLPIFFPALIYLVAFSFDRLMKIRVLIIPSVLLVCILSSVNTYSIIASKYFTHNELSFSNRLSVAKEIVKKTQGRDYNIVGIGAGSQFESFTMNYEYLTWWLGHPPSRENKNIKIYISESNNGIKIK